MKVLDDLTEGKYIRTMVITSELPDSEYCIPENMFVLIA